MTGGDPWLCTRGKSRSLSGLISALELPNADNGPDGPRHLKDPLKSGVWNHLTFQVLDLSLKANC